MFLEHNEVMVCIATDRDRVDSDGYSNEAQAMRVRGPIRTATEAWSLAVNGVDDDHIQECLKVNLDTLQTERVTDDVAAQIADDYFCHNDECWNEYAPRFLRDEDPSDFFDLGTYENPATLTAQNLGVGAYR